ncbi:hypothetical protein BsWGS_28930 [Bradybaena similaris]
MDGSMITGGPLVIEDKENYLQMSSTCSQGSSVLKKDRLVLRVSGPEPNSDIVLPYGYCRSLICHFCETPQSMDCQYCETLYFMDSQYCETPQSMDCQYCETLQSMDSRYCETLQ